MAKEEQLMEVKSQELVIVEEKTKLAFTSVEENNKSALLMINENMEGLIQRANDIVIDINSKDDYDLAVELKRTIKSTHVKIEKRRKELKAPFMEAGKKLDAFVKTIYNPLKDAEQIVKDKCLEYEEEQLRLKEIKQNEEAESQRAEEELNNKLKNLNGYLEKINIANTQDEIVVIEKYLESLDLKSFGDKSADAGFIVTQLKMTCGMAKKILPETAPVKEVPTPKEVVEEPTPIKMEEISVNDNLHKTQSVGRLNRTESKKVELPKDGELDFSKVADENHIDEDKNGMLDFEMEKKPKHFTPEQVNEHLKSGVLPNAIYDGINQDDVIEVQFVDSVQLKQEDSFNKLLDGDIKGLPCKLTIKSVKPNGDVLIGSYVFQSIIPNN
jgi:hypothetical protein